MEMESFLLICMFILACFYFRLSSRITKCEQLLDQLKPTPSNDQLTKRHPIAPPPQPISPKIPETKTEECLPKTPIKTATIPKTYDKDRIEPKKSFRIPNFIKENWMGVFGSIVLVMGAVFFGLTAKIMQHPQSRVAVMLTFCLLLFGISRRLKKNLQWTLLRGWLQSIASTVILFVTIGAGGIKGLQFIHSPSFALGFLCIGIATNILLASITPSQIVASLHVVLSIIAFCTAPQALILLPMGALVAIIGLINAYRAKWDVHLLFIVIAFAFQNYYFSFKLKDELLPWMHSLAIMCSLTVGLMAGLIHYSKKYKSPKLELSPFIAHISNWSLLTFNICLHAEFFRGVPLVLGSIASAGFILARVAQKKGIVWLFHTDTLFSQLLALTAIISCYNFSLNAYDIGLLALIVTMVFSVIFQFQKEFFLVRIGNFSQGIISFITLLLTLSSIQTFSLVPHFTLCLRLGVGITLCWGYYLFSSWKKFVIDDYRFICFGKKEPKKPLSLSVLFGNLFFIALYACGFRYPIIQFLTFIIVLMISLRRKFKEDPSSNLSMIVALILVHTLNWIQLFILSFQAKPPSILSNYNFLGLLFLDLLLLIGNFLEFKRWKKNYTSLLIYALGIQVMLLVYVFTKQISALIPGLVFLGFSLFTLEAARVFPKFLKCHAAIKLKVEESMIHVGLAALIGFLYQFITVHLQIDPIWHRISLRWLTEVLGLSAILYWIIFYPKNPNYLPLTRFMFKRLIETCLGFLTLCIFTEVPETFRPFLWILISMGLLLGTFYFNWTMRLYGYCWFYFIASIVHLAFVTSSLTMPRLFFIEKYYLLTGITIALQFFYTYLVHRKKDIIKQRAKSIPFILNLYHFSNLTFLLPVFLGVALLFAFNFEKTLLTLLWVGLICVYLSVGLLIKSRRSIQIGMASLLLCSGRLIIFDLVQTDLSTRALVFIGVGSLMLGVSALYKKYKHRITAHDKV